MKKQLSILVAVFATVAIVSCSKQKVESVQSSSTGEMQLSNSSIIRDPLTQGLQGWFTFDNNVKDKTGKLADGIPSTRGVIYASDRKGNLKSAIYFDSFYSVKIKSVPQQTHTSVSLWFKPIHFSDAFAGSILSSSAMGPNVHQPGTQVLGTVTTSVSTPGAYAELGNQGWHHVVVTFDGSNMRMYLDNTLSATVPHSATIPASFSDYFLAKSFVWPMWKGYVDELRFYSRTLSASDVTALYNQ